MDAGNADDLLDYLKLDPDHHEKIASLIPQVGSFYRRGNKIRRGNPSLATIAFFRRPGTRC